MKGQEEIKVCEKLPEESKNEKDLEQLNWTYAVRRVLTKVG